MKKIKSNFQYIAIAALLMAMFVGGLKHDVVFGELSGNSVGGNLVLNVDNKVGTVSGTVRDGDGNPIVGATVTATGQSATTNAAGAYSLYPVAADADTDADLTVTAEYTGFPTASQLIDVQDGVTTANVDFVLSNPVDPDIAVTINGVDKGTYQVDTKTSKSVQYSDAVGGPVVITSDNGADIVASLVQLRSPNFGSTWTGIAQIMAVPDGELSDSYVFPYYDGADQTKYNSIEVSNLSGAPTNATIEIGGVVYGPYPIAADAAITKRYTSISDGPVIVKSDNGAQIIAQIYELKRAGNSGLWNGQSQMMGVQTGNLSDTFVLPWYNGTLSDLDATLIFANVDTMSTNITVTINGVDKGTYQVDTKTSKSMQYSDAVGGPVVITSDNGADIVASLVQLRSPNFGSTWTGITQIMAVPDGELSDSYVFPYYDGADQTKYNSIEVSNLSGAPTNATIEIGGVVYGPYPIAADAAITKRYTSISDGPVIVKSDNGAQIIAQIYELKRAGNSGLWNGQSQMMGVQTGNLSDTFVLPWYNGTLSDLDATLIFGAP